MDERSYRKVHRKIRFKSKDGMVIEKVTLALDWQTEQLKVGLSEKVNRGRKEDNYSCL